MIARAIFLCAAVLARAGDLQAAGFADADVLRAIQHAARTGREAGLAPLKSIHDTKAAEMVLGLVAEKRVSDAMKLRLAEIVAQWPAQDGQDFFVRYARQTRQMDDDVLRFLARRVPSMPVALLVSYRDHEIGPGQIRRNLPHVGIVPRGTGESQGRWSRKSRERAGPGPAPTSPAGKEPCPTSPSPRRPSAWPSA